MKHENFQRVQQLVQNRSVIARQLENIKKAQDSAQESKQNWPAWMEISFSGVGQVKPVFLTTIATIAGLVAVDLERELVDIDRELETL